MACEDVCLDMGNYESGEFGRERIQRARREYGCCECRDRIPIGSQYHYCCGKMDGQFWAERTCLVCHEIRTTFSCDGYALGLLWETLDEQVFPEWDEMKAVDCLARLKTDEAIAKVRAKYSDYQKRGTTLRRHGSPNRSGK